MEKVKNNPAHKDDARPVEQAQEANHTERIKAQVLAKIGRPPRLDHVEVSRHHGGNYRVNVWEQPEQNRNFAVTSGARIWASYYLKVSESGDIIHSNPPLAKFGSSA